MASIGHVPDDVLCYMFSFTKVNIDWPIHYIPPEEGYLLIIGVYKYINRIVRTCKRWERIGTKLLDPSDCDSLPLLIAIRANSPITVKRILKYDKVNPMGRNWGGLRSAINQDKTELVRLLLDDRRFKMEDNLQLLMLMWCGDTGAIDVLKYLVEEKGFDPSMNGNACLINACKRGTGEFVTELLKYECIHANSSARCEVDFLCDSDCKKQKITNPDETKEDALIGSIAWKNYKTTKALLKNGRLKLTSRGLAYACQYKDVDIIEPILQLVENPNESSAGHNAPIIECVNFSNHGALDLLLSHPKIDPTVGDNRALKSACGFGDITMVKSLMKTGKINPVKFAGSILRRTIYNRELIFEAVFKKYTRELTAAIESDRNLYKLANSNGVLHYLLAVKVYEKE